MITLLRPWGRRAGKAAKIEPSMPAPAVLFTFMENIAVRAGQYTHLARDIGPEPGCPLPMPSNRIVRPHPSRRTFLQLVPSDFALSHTYVALL